MNPISKQLKIGTIGELLVQIRLLQYDVQAAPALKDSGNDLIGIRRGQFRAIQVKTTRGDRFRVGGVARDFHIVACVHLVGENERVDLNESKVCLLGRRELRGRSTVSLVSAQRHEISRAVVDRLFKRADAAGLTT